MLIFMEYFAAVGTVHMDDDWPNVKSSCPQNRAQEVTSVEMVKI